MYLFDTDIIGNLLKKNPAPSLIRKLALTPPGDQFTSTDHTDFQPAEYISQQYALPAGSRRYKVRNRVLLAFTLSVVDSS